MMRLRLIDPSSSVRYELTFEPLHALLAVAFALALVFALTLLLSPSKRVARVALRDKALLLLAGAAHMAFSRDKAFKASKQPDADLLELMTEPVATKRIILVRHGESLWNSVFNKSPMLLMPLRLARALVYEALVLFDFDSVLFDSPLSAEGRAQARDLADFLSRAHSCPSLVPAEAQADVAAIFAHGASTLVVSSMLRRAVSTAWLALEERLRECGADEPMYLHSALQEMSRNVDTLSLAHVGCAPLLSLVNGDAKSVPDLSRRTNAQYNAGNKAVRAVATTRIGEFAGWCFGRREETIVVVGHSLLFRTMFNLWLPRKAQHVAKTKKIVNCGVVAFTIAQGKLPGSGKPYYRIAPESVVVVYGGFGGK